MKPLPEADKSTGSRETLLSLRDVHKRFGTGSPWLDRCLGMAPKRVLQGVELELAAGQILVIRGSNGAGKTTLLKIAATLLTPDIGQVLHAGRQPTSAARRSVGYCPAEENSFFQRLSAAQNLQFYGGMYGLSQRQAQERAGELADRLAIEPWLHRPVAEASTGVRVRLGLVRALLHAPKLLLLDEPTKSLDDSGRALVAELLGELLASGQGAIVVSHQRDELTELASITFELADGALREC